MLLSAFLALSATLYVSPDGSDSNRGSESRPFATVAQAVRTARAGDTVVVKSGEYRITAPINIGKDRNGLTIRGEGRVVLRGGVAVPESNWRPTRDARVPASSRNHVYEVDLRGITNVSALGPRGFNHQGAAAPVELFVGDEPQTLARWPNTGYVKTGRVTRPGANPREGDTSGARPTFAADRRVASWAQPEDAWVYGYFKWDWADESIPVAEYRDGEITLAKPHYYGVAENRPYYFENVIEELDSPGEYFIDRDGQRLYFWPSKDGDAWLSTTDSYLIRLIDVEGAEIEGLRFETSKGAAIEIGGGRRNTIRSCVFRNLGLFAIKVGSGREHRIESSRFTNLGEGGIQLFGGDRPTLTPANDAVVDCVFERFNRRSRTYRPGVSVNGVGMTVKNNEFRDAPHSAIIFGGNDHIIDGNYFHDLLHETGDGGAVYAGRDWSARGTRISNNLFHRLRGIGNVENGVYLDDQFSGTLVTQNVFSDCRLGLMIGGGRDNTVTENLFVNCGKAMHLDARGLGWAKDGFGGLKASLEKTPFKSELWRRRYPGIERLLEDSPMSPKGNSVFNNVLIDSGRESDTLESAFKRDSRVENNESLSGANQVTVNGRTVTLDSSLRSRVPAGIKEMSGASYGPRVPVPN